MSGLVARVAWYRFRTTWRRRWGGYLTIVALVGLLGGLAMGAIAGARRTQSSFPAFLANSNPSDLTTIYNGADTGYDPILVDTLAHLPHVKHLESVATLNTFEIGSDGVPVESVVANTVGSVDGLLLDQDRAFVAEGRLPDPTRRDEVVGTVDAARALGLHLGSVVHLGFYTQEQTLDPGYGTASVAPYRRADVTLVGIGVTNDAVVQDDFERFAGGLLLTPALTRELLQCCANGTFSGLQLENHSRDVAAVETEIENALPPDTGFYIRDTSVAEAKAERAIKPEAIAFGVFGGIAALAALLIAGQVIGRQLRLGADELEALRALGAGPAMTTSDGFLGIAGAVVAGTLLAGAVAIGLSPLAPIGPVRPVDPSAGIAFDWTVFGLGSFVLAVTLGAFALVLAYRRAPHRLAQRSGHPGERDSTLARRRGVGSARHGGRRHPVRAQPGAPRQHRSGAFGHPRSDARDGRGDRHADLWVESSHARHPSRAVRVELGLRPRTARWRRDHGCTARLPTARPRPQCRRLDGCQLRQPADRRTDHPCPRRGAQRPR